MKIAICDKQYVKKNKKRINMYVLTFLKKKLMMPPSFSAPPESLLLRSFRRVRRLLRRRDYTRRLSERRKQPACVFKRLLRRKRQNYNVKCGRSGPGSKKRLKRPKKWLKE